MAAVLTILCLILVAGTLRAERRGNRRLRYLCKPLASLAFLAIGVSGLDTQSAYSLWIIVGLVLGACGDVALMFRGKRGFLLGLGSFLLGHLAYVLAFASIVPLAQWFYGFALVALFAAAAVLAYLWPHLAAMRWPVVTYVVAIVLMVLGALAVHDASPAIMPTGAARLALAGALLFFVSDVSVAKSRFVRARFVDKLWGLPAYYLGQLCIAWSLY